MVKEVIVVIFLIVYYPITIDPNCIISVLKNFFLYVVKFIYILLFGYNDDLLRFINLKTEKFMFFRLLYCDFGLLLV